MKWELLDSNIGNIGEVHLPVPRCEFLSLGRPPRPLLLPYSAWERAGAFDESGAVDRAVLEPVFRVVEAERKKRASKAGTLHALDLLLGNQRLGGDWLRYATAVGGEDASVDGLISFLFVVLL
jgi:hypothetical protein